MRKLAVTLIAFCLFLATIAGIEFPRVGEYHYRLIAKLFARQRDLTKEHVPGMKEFVVAFFPQENFYSRSLIPYLEKEKIKVLDYSQISSHVLNNTFRMTVIQPVTSTGPIPGYWRKIFRI